MKFNIKALALTCGIFWGLSLLLIAWWLMFLGHAADGTSFLERAYIGYHYTWVGSFIGLAWGFADGLVCGAIFGWLYNRLAGNSASE